MAALTISKEEEQRLKGLGFLNNKGTDNFSARVITVNGKVTVAQMPGRRRRKIWKRQFDIYHQTDCGGAGHSL